MWWLMSKDPDALYDDEVIAVLEIKVRRNGAMSVAGSINDERYALAMLDSAKDSIKAHNRRNRGEQSQLILPAHDTALA